jgi:hypothetical protein
MGPLSIDEVFVLMPAFSQRQLNLKVPVSIAKGLSVHGLLLLPETPVAHDAHLLRELVKLGDPIEVYCLSGATSRMAVSALKALVL